MTPIGGYFGLELRAGQIFHDNMLMLNSGRDCLGLVLSDFGAARVYLPKYSCGVLREAIDDLKVDVVYYSLNSSFYPSLPQTFSLGPTDLFLYTNYFGCFFSHVRKLAGIFKENLIIDNAQAFFARPIDNVATFYSPRKFFGVPDGGLLHYSLNTQHDLKRAVSLGRLSHLLKRIELGPEAGYADFVANDKSLSYESGTLMSNLTSTILHAIDYPSIAEKRNQNFIFVHDRLGDLNEIKVFDPNPNGPMCYPLLLQNGRELRNYLIENRVYIPKYWPDLLCSEGLNPFESLLVEDLVCLPIDQRYTLKEMGFVVSLIESFGK